MPGKWMQVAPVMLVGSDIPYQSLSTAYSDASNGSELRSWDVIFNEDFHLNKAVDVTIMGGYTVDFNQVSGFTTLEGIFYLEQGSAIIDHFIIQ
jgi:hypothetical protein